MADSVDMDAPENKTHATNIEKFDNLLTSIAHRFARRGDDALVDDLVQAARIAVWKRSGSYNPALSSPTSFAFMIARNAMIDHLRSRESRSCAETRLTDDIATTEQTEELEEDHKPDPRLAILLKPSAYFAPGEADVISAIKRHGGDRQRARQSLRMTPVAFRSALARARRRFTQIAA